MDTPILVVPILIVLALLAPRLLLASVGSAGDVLAQLFVPPDRALGWPHGVQESDAPWGWQPGAAAQATAPAADQPVTDLDDVLDLAASGRAGYVEPPHRVAPIRFRARPH